MTAWDTSLVIRNTLIILFFVTPLLYSCSRNVCDNKLREEVPSPNGEYVVSIIERNCGATTPFMSLVSIRRSDSSFDAEDYENWVFTIEGKSNIAVSWEENKKLKITYTGTGSTPNQKKTWNGIEIVS